MSPRITLRCYPDDDGGFASSSTTTLEVHLPNGPDGLVDAVLEQLRAGYPDVVIKVEPVAGSAGGEFIWHVYRDGAAA